MLSLKMVGKIIMSTQVYKQKKTKKKNAKKKKKTQKIQIVLFKGILHFDRHSGS